MVAAAIVGSAVVGGFLQSDAQSSAADSAASAQTQSSAAGIAEQRYQFDALKALLKPYSDAGLQSLSGQQDLLGLNGGPAQQNAITGIQNSPAFGALTQQGENAILQNASATGGLRGGNVQSALAQFRPQLLAQLIEQQFGKLGGITSIGQNAAAGQGNAGMNTGNNIATLMQQGGAAQAGAAIAQGRAQSTAFGALGGGLGLFYGMNGFNNGYSNPGAGNFAMAGPGYQNWGNDGGY